MTAPGELAALTVDEHLAAGSNPFDAVSLSGVDWPQCFRATEREVLQEWCELASTARSLQSHCLLFWRAASAAAELARRAGRVAS